MINKNKQKQQFLPNTFFIEALLANDSLVPNQLKLFGLIFDYDLVTIYKRKFKPNG